MVTDSPERPAVLRVNRPVWADPGHIRGQDGGVQDYCDWCYGPLTEAVVDSVTLNRFLKQAEAYACPRCVESRAVLAPPESMDLSDEQGGDESWRTAVEALLRGDESALPELLRVAGYADR